MPIVSGLNFGHTEPNAVLPYGLPALVDPAARTIALLEAAVRA